MSFYSESEFILKMPGCLFVFKNTPGSGILHVVVVVVVDGLLIIVTYFKPQDQKDRKSKREQATKRPRSTATTCAGKKSYEPTGLTPTNLVREEGFSCKGESAGTVRHSQATPTGRPFARTITQEIHARRSSQR